LFLVSSSIYIEDPPLLRLLHFYACPLYLLACTCRVTLVGICISFCTGPAITINADAEKAKS
jgi:hypothetical protein